MKGISRQYYATVVVNLPSIIYGLSCTWSSPYVPLLLSNATPLASGPMSAIQVSWVVAAVSVGGLCSCILSGLLLDYFGRKRVMVFVALPQLLSWLWIYAGRDDVSLYIGRVLEGIAAGAAGNAGSVFVAEISDSHRRGLLGGFRTLLGNIGMLLGYVLTTFLTYHQVAFAGVILSVLYAALCLTLAESPAYLEMKNRIDEAKKSYAYYGWQKSVQLSLLSVPDVCETKAQRREPEPTKMIARALVIAVFSLTSGVVFILSFTKSIYDEAGCQMSSGIASIIIGSILFLGSCVSTIAMDKMGRKYLLVVSSFCSSFTLALAGFYYYMKLTGLDTSSFSYLPLICISVLFFVAPLGLLSVPAILITEMLPIRLRGIVFTFCMAEVWGLVIIGNRFFLTVVISFGMYTFMWFFAVTSFAVGVYTYFFLPETKGKSFGSIANLFDRDQNGQQRQQQQRRHSTDL